MHHIIYLSRATAPFGETQLRALLARARQRNTQQGLTGIRLYGDDQFFQVLEGEEAHVRQLYERICQDPRHCDITKFADVPIMARAFPDWNMAFRALLPQQFIELAGYRASAPAIAADAPPGPADAQLLQLLHTFG